MIRLDELTAESAASLTPRERREVLRRCAALSLAVASAEEPEPADAGSQGDHYLSAAQTAAAIARSESWVRHAHLPFQIGRNQYSEVGLRQWMEQQRLRAKRRNA